MTAGLGRHRLAPVDGGTPTTGRLLATVGECADFLWLILLFHCFLSLGVGIMESWTTKATSTATRTGGIRAITTGARTMNAPATRAGRTLALALALPLPLPLALDMGGDCGTGVSGSPGRSVGW